jgi:Phosphoenolpyruvate carboxykinase
MGIQALGMGLGALIAELGAKAAAMPNASSSRRKPSPRVMLPANASARCWKTSCLTREPDFDDGLKIENTRSAYPLEFIPSASRSDRAGHPKNLVCRRRFGVMPPIAKLTPAQAISLKLGDANENVVRDLL